MNSVFYLHLHSRKFSGTCIVFFTINININPMQVFIEGTVLTFITVLTVIECISTFYIGGKIVGYLMNIFWSAQPKLKSKGQSEILGESS